jgi:HEAT repeat protein
VAVEVGTAEGPRRLQGWLLDGDLELSEPLAAPPLYVALDPEGGLLARVDQQQQPAEWEAQLQSAAPYARLRAAEALGKVKRPEALAKRLLDRQLPLPERRAAAAALGEQRAALPLLAAAADPHAGIRKAVAEALGRCLGPDVRRALERLLADPNPDVAGAALRSLHRLEPAAALQQARRHVGDYRPEANQLREAAVDVLAERGDRYDLPALLRPSTQGRSRNAALRAAARIALREPEDSRRDQARRQVSDAALLLLQDLDLRSRATGLSVLTEAGHPSAISALEAYARSSTLPEQSAAARSAIQAIEAAAPAATAQPNEAEARLKAAEERLKALEQRIQELEEGH